MTQRVGGLFAGVGGLEQGIQAVLPDAVPAWFVENDPAACRVLEHRYPGVPNLGDITRVDWTQVPPVDVLAGGFPCQDVSSAGLRKGLRPGTRSGLWSHFAQAIAILRPGLVVIENVRGLLSAEAHSVLESGPGGLGDGSGRPVLRALGAVLGDLADVGFDAVWQGLRAADVGAPHGRFRVFVVAWPADSSGVGSGPSGAAGGESFRADGPRGGGAESADSSLDAWRVDDRDRLRARRGEVGRGQATGSGPSPDAGGEAGGVGSGLCAAGSGRGGRGRPVNDGLEAPPDAGRIRSDAGIDAASGEAEPEERSLSRVGGGASPESVDWRGYGPAIRRWERTLGRVAPAPRIDGPRGGPVLSGRFTEWLMGYPAGWITDTPGISNNDALRLCGNGVVPQQAAEALRVLLAATHNERRRA